MQFNVQAFQSDSIIKNTQNIRMVNWCFPPAAHIKLNTDGSVKAEATRYGYGGIFRPDSGSWMGGYYGRLTTCSSLEAELHAIFVGLELLKAQGWGNIFVETDSMAAIELTKGPKNKEHP